MDERAERVEDGIQDDDQQEADEPYRDNVFMVVDSEEELSEPDNPHPNLRNNYHIDDSEDSDGGINPNDPPLNDRGHFRFEDSEDSDDGVNPNNPHHNDENNVRIEDSEDSAEEDDEAEIDDPERDDNDEAGINRGFDDFFYINVRRGGMEVPLRAVNNNSRIYEKLLVDIAKALRFKHTYKSMLFSFKQANFEFDNAHFPTTMKVFWQLVNRNLGHFERSIVCTICWEELGHAKEPARFCGCGETGPGKLSELGTYLYLNLPIQLQGLLEKTGMATALEYPWTRVKQNPDAIEDVYDGEVYRELSTGAGFLSRGRCNYSLAIWTDGISPAPSSSVTIWPIFVQILELSPRARQRNSLLAALYTGPRKPQMQQFLTPFTLQLRQLTVNGITWNRNGGAGQVISRFIPLIISADSEARYLILGLMRLNARWGCTYCYAQTTNVGDRHQYQIYRYFDDPDNPGYFAADRTDNEIREDAELAEENDEPVHGVRCISALSIVPGFDLRKSQLVEALHCLWERNFTRLYGILTDPGGDDHINPRNVKLISDRIQQVKPPTKIARYPRPLEYIKKFKGTEFRNLAWYFWLPCANDFMTPSQVESFALFADATYVLNKDSILDEELIEVDEKIHRFRRQSAEDLPERLQTYNLHLLKHVVRCVRELGPLWVASGFWFESINRQIKNYITSPTDRPMQIACRILLAQMIEKCFDWPLSPGSMDMLRELMHKARWLVIPNLATGTYRLYFKEQRGLLNAEEIVALNEAGFEGVGEEIRITRYKKLEIDGVVYQPPSDQEAKYDNSVIYVTPRPDVNDTLFIRINSIIKWQHGNDELEGVIGNRFITVGVAFNTTYMKIVRESQDLVYLPVRLIKAPAVLVEASGTTYASPIPNRWDVD